MTVGTDQFVGSDSASSPLVSIGLPTFNRASSLARAIESVLDQDLRDIELVISDNASTDSTERICREFSARDARVRYIRQPANQGAIANFQSVLNEARGEYFMWLSDDDWLDQAYLSRCVGALRGDPDSMLVCGTTKYVDSAGHEYTGVVVDLPEESPFDRVLGFYSHVNDNGTFYGVARREVLLSHPTRNQLGADWLHVATLALLGKVRTLDDVSIHRSRDGAGADVRALARSLGMSEKAARQPHRAIASIVAMDIAVHSKTFASLGFAKRWRLALLSARAVHRRFVVPDHPLESRSQRMRTRLLRALRIS